MTLRKFFLAAALPFAALPSAAFAQDDETEAAGPIDIEVGADVVSDYRFRGISLSDKDFAFQPSITVSHESGLYVSAWGSNIAPNGGDDIEVDLVAGFSTQAGPVNFDINATYYVYPGTSGLDYVEFISRTSTAVGPGEMGVTLAYVPSQDNTGNQDNVYVALDGSFPISGTPLSINGSFGFEDGAFGDNKKDWSLGLSAEVGPGTIGVAYVDTAHAAGFGTNADAGVVFTAGLVF